MAQSTEEPPPQPPIVPNLLVIGAQKCGTTWLHHWLTEHPQVRGPRPKEPRVLLRPEARAEDFTPYFTQGAGDRYTVDSTTDYLWTHNALNAEAAARPDVAGTALRLLGADLRLVVSFRHPVARAISAYMHHLRRARFSPEQRLRDVANQFGILEMGHYASQIAAWQRVFAPECFHVVLHDEIEQAPGRVLRRLLKWLDLPPFPTPGLRDAENRGIHLHMVEGRAMVDMDDPEVAVARKRNPDLALEKVVIEQADVDALLPHYREDIEHISRVYRADRFGWPTRTRLKDFIGPR